MKFAGDLAASGVLHFGLIEWEIKRSHERREIDKKNVQIGQTKAVFHFQFFFLRTNNPRYNSMSQIYYRLVGNVRTSATRKYPQTAHLYNHKTSNPSNEQMH